MKQLLVMFFLLCSVTVFAQDVIVKKDGSTIVCRIVKADKTMILYKSWNNLNGKSKSIMRSEVKTINYQNGRREELADAEANPYTQGNQYNGFQAIR